MSGGGGYLVEIINGDRVRALCSGRVSATSPVEIIMDVIMYDAHKATGNIV
jgi:hypothetical protein